MKKLFLLKILSLILAVGSVYSQSVFIPTGGKTIYDLQAVGSAVHIIQDKNNPERLHAVYTSSPYNDSITFAARTVQYYYSSNGGASWSFITSFPQIYKAGFPSIALLPGGMPVITFHGGQDKRTYTFTATGPGVNSFISLGNTNCFGRTPQIAASRDIAAVNKFHIINSEGFSSGLSLTDSLYTNCTNIDGLHPDAISVNVSNDGKVGVAFVVDPLQMTGNSGDVFFMQSTDNGVTFGAPVKIFDAAIDNNGLYNGGFRGISLVYNNNTPNIVFEITLQDIFGGYHVTSSAAILHWSPDNPGTGNQKCKYIARNDSASQVSFVPFYRAFGNDVLTSLSRPSIGTFSDSNYMAVVFMASTPYVKVISADTVCYNALYVTYTSNKGASWSKPKKITPDEARDWTYPSMSFYNSGTTLPYMANITATKDSLPGSYFNNSFFGRSLAEQYYIKTPIGTDEPFGLTITSGKVRYNDNNELVTNGIVKAMRYNEATGEVVVMATGPIDANGNYSLAFQPPYFPSYIVAYPNSEKTSDFVPTYFPQTIEWQLAQIVNASNNNENINIGVFRMHELGGSLRVSGHVNANISSANQGIKEALVYVKQNDSFVRFSETNCSGEYSMEDFSQNRYSLIATKLGYSTAIQTINLISTLDTLNFYLSIIINVHTISSEVPKSYNLYQNYPNPFNPVTRIKFDIPKKAFVSLKVFNILGKEVADLLNETKTAGSYAADFNGQGLASGIYFYRITAGDYTQTKRMVIVK
jgi:hypothetical protein